MSLAFNDAGLRGYLQLGFDMWLPVYSTLPAWFKEHGNRLSDDPNSTPFASKYHGTLFDHLSQNPAQAAVFDQSMEHLAYPIAKVYPFGDCLRATDDAVSSTLVDIGGGRGQVSREILAECPSLAGRIILQDQASVLKHIPEDLIGKVEPMPCSFFEPQKVKGAFELLPHTVPVRSETCKAPNPTSCGISSATGLIRNALRSLEIRPPQWRQARGF